jgi:hypothetical protein
MSSSTAILEEIQARVAEMPAGDLPRLLEYLDSLDFGRRKTETTDEEKREQKTPFRVVVKLGGLWKDHPISDEEIAAARKEMWTGFGEIDL